ncbi:MAG: hypothetical protein ICV31_01835 [Rubrobacter sp.]|nr:hypothetical protein [Rubrobacter sp.]
MGTSVRTARDAARRWVLENAAVEPGFRGAFYHGSIGWLPDNDVLPATSDVDVMVVFDDAEHRTKPGKFRYEDVLLEVSYLPAERLGSPEIVLGQPELAGSFRLPSVISDPSGLLTRLQVAVARDYARRKWVCERCAGTRDNILRYLRLLDRPGPFHDAVTNWLFATGSTTLMPLVAGLRNPTVRKRYTAARELLADYERQDFYDTLLRLLGCAAMERARAEHHLGALTGAFDAARVVVRTPFFFTSDISEDARAVAIDGSSEMIEAGDHREAVFWMLATFARCQKIFYHDAPALQEKYDAGFRELLGDLGIASFGDLRWRGAEVEAFLPRLWDVTEAIVAANRDVEE